MRRNNFILAMLAFGGLTATAQINSSQSLGYEVRAAEMFSDGNFQGCVDQCQVALQLGSNRREQLVWLSAVAAFNGGMPESSSYVTAYIRQFPSGDHILSARLLLATLWFYEGDYRIALKLFEAINSNSLSDNEREDLTYRKAYSLMQLGRYEQAKSLMQELTGTKRYGDAAVFYEAYMAFAEGEYNQALDLFAKCNKLRAPGDMADYYVVQILFKKKQYADALNTLMPLMSRKDISEEIKDETERIAGECFYALHDDNRAMVYLNSYMERHSSEAPLSTRYIVGVERYQTGDYEQALELLAPVSKLTDEMGQSAALTMGQAYMAKGNVKAAMIAFDKAAKLDFNAGLTELAYYNYAVAQVDGGRLPFGNSVQTLEDFLKRYPNSRYAGSVREYLIKGYMATDDYSGALRSLNAIKDDKQSESIGKARQQVNFVLGTRALQSGQSGNAVNYLKEALRYGNCDAGIERQTRLWLGDAYYALGNYPLASEQYRDYLSVAPKSDINRSLAQYNLAYARFAQRDYDESRRMFVNVVNDRSQTADIKTDAYNRIGDTYYYTRDFSGALNAYRSAYDITPEAGDYSLLQIAMMQGHLGHMTDKLKTLEDFVVKYPSSSLKATAQNEIAQTHVVIGQPESAIAMYKHIATTHQSTAQGRNALLQLAILSDNAGDSQTAKSYYRQVISDYPTSSEASLAVQDLKRIYGEEGNIEQLNVFLESVSGAPQLDATEKNAIAASGLLRKARAATTPDSKLAAAEELLSSYPDAEGAEEALAISAQAYFDKGVADKALTRFSELEKRTSDVSMLHTARMGILRSASDMGEYGRILSVSEDILGSGTLAGMDFQEIMFLRAVAFARTGDSTSAIKLWEELAKTPANLYGARSAFEIADSHYKSGDIDLAVISAEALIDANPPHAYWLARTFILYSDILRTRGQDFEADEYLRVLRTNYPGTESDIFQMIDKRLQ